jgi:hypothetical protein
MKVIASAKPMKDKNDKTKLGTLKYQIAAQGIIKNNRHPKAGT